MTISLKPQTRDHARQLTEAFASGDKQVVERALEDYRSSILEDVTQQYEEAVATGDRAVLAQRGFRQLTSAEQSYYQGLIDALSSDNPRQAFADFSANGVPDRMMPTSIFDQILKDIAEAHPLLAALDMVNVGFVTTWLRNKHTSQLAAWGSVGEAVTKEITSAFEAVDVKQGKLSCFALVSVDMLRLGPTWLDGYVRTVIGEAMASGLEYGVVAGKGVAGEPIGLVRDIHEGVTVNTATGYPEKEAVAVTDLSPASYGALVAKLAKNEAGRIKSIDFRGDSGLSLICNPVDYLTKVMPATTVQATTGQYVRDLFPLPTQTFPSAAVEEGKAVLALLGEYTVLVGGSRGIEYSDEYKFLEDQRAFKAVEYAFGRADDDTSAIVLDISALDPAYVTVKTAGGTAKAAK